MSKKKCCKSEEACKEVEAQEVTPEVPAHCDGKTTCDKDCVIVLEDAELEELREFDKKLADAKGQLADLVMQRRELLKQADDSVEKVANTLETVRNDYIAAAKALAKTHGVDMDVPNQGNWSLSLSNKTLTKV
jgi:hypothetical protein